MSAFLPDSPFHIVLAESSALALTPDQGRDLLRLDIEFRRRCGSLLNERYLVELDALGAMEASPSGLGFTAESLAAADAITANLRQIFLRAWEEARALLSSEQLAKFGEGGDAVPSFGSESMALISTSLDSRIAEAVAARIKDAKVVEIETAQAIAERILGWAKSAAPF